MSETWTCTADRDAAEGVTAYQRILRNVTSNANRGNKVWLLRRVGDGPVAYVRLAEPEPEPEPTDEASSHAP